jgi:predicted amino acid dehydrogenase
VMSTSFLPQVLFSDREATLQELGRIVRFIRKLSRRNVYVGLAAWWPIVTNSGLAFKRFLQDDDAIIITNGHTATLLSIYLTVERIASLSVIPLSDLKILILGAGRVGGACARLLNGKVRSIGIVDTNEARGNTVRQELEGKVQKTALSVYVASDVFLQHSLPALLSEYDITICTASNTNYIIEDPAKLKDCIIIDDSRPEAFPRIVSEKDHAVVLEGGLIKFAGITVDADFGFGSSDNVFGCMAESIMLALDKMESLKPTVGEVDPGNFSAMAVYCKERRITEGALMSGGTLVPPGLLRSIIARKRSGVYSRA